MKDRVFILHGSYVEIADTGDTFGKLQLVSLTAQPETQRGLWGHQIQIASALPEVVSSLIQSGLLPCVFDVELAMRTSGGKASVYVKNATPVAETNTAWPEFISKAFSAAPTSAPEALSDRFLILSASHVMIAQSKQSFGSFQALSMTPPEVTAGKAGHEVQKLSADPVLVQSLGRQGHIPCISSLTFAQKASGGKSVYYAKTGEIYPQTAGMWAEFLKSLKAEKQPGRDKKTRGFEAAGVNL